MGIFGGGGDRQELLALENRVVRLEEQVARLLAAAEAAATRAPTPDSPTPDGPTPHSPIPESPASAGPAEIPQVPVPTASAGGSGRGLTPVVPASVSEVPLSSLAPVGGLTQDAVDEARRLKHDGKAIHAIKIVRERTGWSLRDAKHYVDQL